MLIFIKYLLAFFLVSFIGGSLSYFLYPYFVKEEISTNRYDSALAVSAFITIITLSAYLLFRYINRNSYTTIWTRSIFCLLFPPILWSIFQSFVFGMHFSEFVFILLSIGLSNSLIPFFKLFFDRISRR